MLWRQVVRTESYIGKNFDSTTLAKAMATGTGVKADTTKTVVQSTECVIELTRLI